MDSYFWILVTSVLRGLAIAAAILFIVALASCTNKPVVLPPGTTICQDPYYGEDCLDSYGKFYLFNDGLPCNTCLSHSDYLSDKNGCAWASSPGAPNLWCTTDCRSCSAIISTFTKKN